MYYINQWFICHSGGRIYMTNYKHLLYEQRDTIQYMIERNYSFTQIGKAINKHRTTISNEIKRNRYIKSSFFEMFDQKGINKAVNDCLLLRKPPYVCNTCVNKYKCNKHKLYYKSKVAQEKYETLIKESREGVDITKEVIEEIEEIIIPLIKDKKQSINQVYANHSDILYFTKPTFYKYIDLGVLSLSTLDLPKKVKYKARKKEERIHKRQLALLKGRTYKEYLDFIIKHPNRNIVELDTVQGLSTDNKVLLTIIIKKTKFMLIFLLDKQNMECVTKTINDVKDKLGVNLYSKVFKIILTDNGSEFFNPLGIELDYNTGKKIVNLFYCDPYSAWQKGTLEKNHVFIRTVFPKSDEFTKGFSFEGLDQKKVKRLEDNINNIPRLELNNKTPYQLTKELYPELLEKLNCSYILPDDVNLSLEHILGS